MPLEEKPLGFESLGCYQLSLKLYDAAYRLALNLPIYEKYNMADQLRRCSLSTLLNIAEGYGRYHYMDKLRFFSIARGSLCETLRAFVCAYQAGYIDESQLIWAREMETEAEKALNGYMGFIRRQKLGGDEFENKYIKEIEMTYEAPSFHEDERSSP